MSRDAISASPTKINYEQEIPPASPSNIDVATIVEHTDLSEKEVEGLLPDDQAVVEDQEPKKEEDKEGEISKKEAEAKFIAELMPQLIQTLKKLTIESQENSDQANEKIIKTLEYFLSETEYVNLAGENIKQTPAERIASQYFPLLEGETDPNRIAELKEYIGLHASEVIALAFRQQLDNPEKYVSHGFDHTLNVASQADKIVESNPAVLEAIKEKYGLDDKQAKFVNILVAWFHDFGYPAIGQRDKAAHAITGADIIDSPIIRGLHRQLLAGENTNINLLLADLKDAVLFHGADKIERAFDAKFATTHGEYLVDSQNVIEIFSQISNTSAVDGEQNHLLQIFVNSEESKSQLELALQQAIINYGLKSKIPEIIVENKEYVGRLADFSTAKDKLIGLEFKQVDVMTSPLHAIVRLADNVDMTEARFSELQRLPAFKEVYRLLGDTTHRFGNATIALEKTTEENFAQMLEAVREIIKLERTSGENLDALNSLEERIAEVNNPKQLLESWKRFIVEKAVTEHPPSDPAVINDLVRLALEQNSQALRHFGGCEAIKEVNLVGNQLVVSVDKEKYDALNKIQVVEHTKVDGSTETNTIQVGVGEYQIWRAKQAYESITFNGDKIEVVINVVTKDEQKDAN